MTRITFLTTLLATPVFADTPTGGHMMDWGYGYGIGMMFGPVLWIVVLGLVVAGVAWFIRGSGHGSDANRKSDALAELDMRLARGEIDAEDYSARRKLLGS